MCPQVCATAHTFTHTCEHVHMHAHHTRIHMPKKIPTKQSLEDTNFDVAICMDTKPGDRKGVPC